MSRRKYAYQVVSGAAVFGRPRASVRAASIAAARLRDSGAYATWHFELERIYESAYGVRSYWRMRGARWVPWTPSADAEDRRPAKFWPALEGTK